MKTGGSQQITHLSRRNRAEWLICSRGIYKQSSKKHRHRNIKTEFKVSIRSLENSKQPELTMKGHEMIHP